MHRRAFLSVLAAGVAGCGGGQSTPTASPSTSTPTDSRSATPSPDGTPHRSTTASAPDVPRTYEEAVRNDLLSVTAGEWVSKDRIRWYDDVENRIEWVQPQHGAFFQVELTFLNIEDNSVQTPKTSVFELYVNGSTYPLVTDLPGGVRWSQLRQRPHTPTLTKPNYGNLSNRFLDGGELVSGKLLFDAPKTDQPLVRWTHEKPVEGTDQPVHLLPRRAD